MFFFKRRKKEKTLENKFDELNEGILNEKDRENPQKWSIMSLNVWSR